MKNFKTVYCDSISPNFRTISLGENVLINHNGYNKGGYVSKIFNNGKVRIKFHVWKGYVDYCPNSDGNIHIPFVN